MSSAESAVPEFVENFDDTMNDIDDLDNIIPIKRRGKGVVYDFFKTVSTDEFITEFKAVKGDDDLIKSFEFDTYTFKYKYKRSTIKGLKYFYECSPDAANCSVCCYIFLGDTAVSIFISDVAHEHVDRISRGISDVVKDAINKLYDVGVTAPKAILRALEKQNLIAPSIYQLNNYLFRLRKEKYGPCSINIVDLEMWCKSRSDLPDKDDLDKVFVVKFQHGIDDDVLRFFRLIVSTRRLL